MFHVKQNSLVEDLARDLVRLELGGPHRRVRADVAEDRRALRVDEVQERFLFRLDGGAHAQGTHVRDREPSPPASRSRVPVPKRVPARRFGRSAHGVVHLPACAAAGALLWVVLVAGSAPPHCGRVHGRRSHPGWVAIFHVSLIVVAPFERPVVAERALPRPVLRF